MAINFILKFLYFYYYESMNNDNVRFNDKVLMVSDFQLMQLETL